MERGGRGRGKSQPPTSGRGDEAKMEFYPHTGSTVYDGKRMRKAVKRPTVDYHSSMIRLLEVRECTQCMLLSFLSPHNFCHLIEIRFWIYFPAKSLNGFERIR